MNSNSIQNPQQSEQLLAQVCAMWCEVLNLTQCKPDDDFLSLGGNSLTAMKLSLIIKKSFAVNYATAYFDGPRTPRIQAQRIADLIRAATPSEASAN